jgi:hypothetical protein
MEIPSKLNLESTGHCVLSTSVHISRDGLVPFESLSGHSNPTICSRISRYLPECPRTLTVSNIQSHIDNMKSTELRLNTPSSGVATWLEMTPGVSLTSHLSTKD